MSHPSDQTPTRINTILSTELALSNELLDILQKEYNSLSNNDSAMFLALVEKKQTCAEKIQEVEKQLTQHLASQGYNHNKSDIEKLINTLSPDVKNTTLDTWQSLLNVAQQCKQQNQVNGRTINLTHLKTKHAMALLSGKEASPATYDQSGKTDDNSSSPSIVIV